MHRVRDQAKAVHRVFAYSDTNKFLPPAFFIDTEIERGVREEVVLLLSWFHQIQGVYTEEIHGGMICMTGFQKKTQAATSSLNNTYIDNAIVKCTLFIATQNR